MAELIEKNIALAKIDEFAELNKAHGFPVDIFDMEMLKKMIEKIPAADVAQVVHGRWSNEMVCVNDSFGNMHYGYRCSICNGVFNKYAYCGGCGAKMDEEVNE